MNKKLLITFAIILGSFIFFTKDARATEWYVTTSGSSGGDGSATDPWDLATAFAHPASVQAGDTIWVRAGTYESTYLSDLTGADGNPIIIRAYPDERVTLDGGTISAQAVLEVDGDYTYYWGFEIMRSDTNRISQDSGSYPTDVSNIPGVWTDKGDGNKFINLIVHDTSGGYGYWRPATNSEIYGNLIYYNGWQAPDRGHGHAIYAQNVTGTKTLKDNIIFNQAGWGINCYSTNAELHNFTIDGNIAFNNGALSGKTTYYANILLGGENVVAENPTITNNYTYFDNNKTGGGNFAGYHAGCDNLTATGNYFAQPGDISLSVNCTNVTLTNNIFYGDNNPSSSTYPDNFFYTTESPVSNKVYVDQNDYESDRAHIAIYNWEGLNTVYVDPLNILSSDQTYEIYDVENYYGDPIATGVYTGSRITVPMTSTAVSDPVGLSAPSHTSSEFGAFILLAGSSATTTNVTSPPSTLVPASPSIPVGGEYNPSVKQTQTATGKTYVTVSLDEKKGRRFLGTAKAGAKVRILVKSDKNKIPGIATADKNGSWSWEYPTRLEPGEYTATFVAKDEEGNSGAITLSFSIQQNGSAVLSQTTQHEIPENFESESKLESETGFVNKIISILDKIINKVKSLF